MAGIGPGSPKQPEKKIKVKVPTDKLVLAIVEMYSSQEHEMQKLAGELAACIFESYNDKDEMKKDILGTYTGKKIMIEGMVMNIKRQFPEESKILSEVFGLFLFGEKL